MILFCCINAIFYLRFYFGSLFFGYIVGVWIFGPIFVLTKLLQICYPWIIVGYLIENNLLFSDNRPDLFQLVMLSIYCFLQIMLLIVGIFVFRIHFWLWHIEPGRVSVYWESYDDGKLVQNMNGFYQKISWYPAIKDIIIKKFGIDIANIVLLYYNQIDINDAAQK